MTACYSHPGADRYVAPDGYARCAECRRERKRRERAQARNGRPAASSRPGKLAGREHDVYAALDLGVWSQREVADAFGVSPTRISQLIREREATP